MTKRDFLDGDQEKINAGFLMAATGGDAPSLRMILANGADPKAVSEESGLTALMFAATTPLGDWKEACSVLIPVCDTKALTKDGRDVFEIIEGSGKKERLEEFLALVEKADFEKISKNDKGRRVRKKV